MGHLTIGIIVYAFEAEEAKGEVEMVLDKICGDGEAFDYYDTGDSEAFRVDSPEGKRFIDDLMDDAKSRFMKNLKAVRGVLGFFSDEELYNAKMGDLATMTLKLKNDQELTFDFGFFDFYCHCLSRYEGPEVLLYNRYGGAIGDPEELKEALAVDPDLADQHLFVGTADVHY